ncbi:MAG: cbb3-type cytochrome c oxidase subunit I [Acidimicrobiia bacterium]|nr:MAG: cbb3-type cytochrome c oxidase subunit I [Acidimicrobiia bacterium]
MTSALVRSCFVAAAAFLIIGLALYGLAATQLAWPGVFEGSANLSYGRLLPAGSAALVFGWLTLALLGVSFHAVPRMVDARLRSPLAAIGATGLIAVATAAGVGAILLGDGEGGRWLEFPAVVDAALFAGCLGVAALLVATVRDGSGAGLPVAGWYLTAAPVWLFLTVAVAALPALDGLPGEIQSGFVGSALWGLWAGAAGIGVAYYLSGRLLPDATFHESLGRIGFWSLSLTWLWTAGRTLQFAPTPDWVETIPVVFGAGLVVAVVTVVADFAMAWRGRRGEVAAAPALRMVGVGLVFLLTGVIAAVVASLRSVASVLRFTPWESGVEVMLLLGAFTMFAMAAVIHVASATRGKEWGRSWGRLALWPVVAGVVIAAGSRFVAGVQQGFGWLSGVQSGSWANLGDGFEVSVVPLQGANAAQAVGIALVLIGATAFAVRLGSLAGGGGVTESVRPAAGAVAPVTGLLRVAVAIFLLGAVGAFALPAVDADAGPTELAETSRDLADDAQADLGRQIYLAEGCWLCHTQQVRQVVTDVGLGPVTLAGDLAFDPVGVAGYARVGPDLAHAGVRPNTNDVAFLRRHLADPRDQRPWSTMPSYRHLSADEMNALAAYVAGLE